MLQVHGFVNHSGYLAVAAEGYPADSKFGLAPVPSGKGLAARIEEQVELFHPDSENARPHEMPELVCYDKQREGEYYLQGLN